MPGYRSYCNFVKSLRTAALCLLLGTGFEPALEGFEGEDAACVGCHTTEGLTTRFAGSEVLPLTVDVESLKGSVHGGMACTACHSNIEKFPHPENTARDHREFQLENSDRCRACHAGQFEELRDSNHARALAAGNRDAAVCIDCHGSHAVARPGRPRHRIPTSCGKCHSAIYAGYIGSVHGESLLENGNPDVPVCTDCHGVHSQADPERAAFRLKSPRLCEKCHGDADMMRKYDISADVFNTYVADFHGMTITLFEKQHPDQPVNTAVCTDCHGIHDIMGTKVANSNVIKENLLGTCRRCHPDASATFPDSWVGHFPPSWNRYPLVYFTDLFYRFLIPITIGGMALFVIIDAGGRIIRAFRKGRTGRSWEEDA
ncbi:MAG: cytochrome c3 family protein [Acidobacteria bacterium]|nr:cytochrome c3 family protein [Acidobacteriota bacterium]